MISNARACPDRSGGQLCFSNISLAENKRLCGALTWCWHRSWCAVLNSQGLTRGAGLQWVDDNGVSL